MSKAAAKGKAGTPAPSPEKQTKETVTWVEQMQRSRRGPPRPQPGPALRDPKQK